MVEVFKTDIEDISLAEKVKFKLSELMPDSLVSFDLEDCDRVLRVQAKTICPATVMEALKKEKINCEIMDW